MTILFFWQGCDKMWFLCILHSTQSNCCSAKLLTSFLLSYSCITVQSLTPLTRVGSVWIFQFWLGSFFNLKYSVSLFFGFGIRTPLQCKSILLVCENTKTESINFHKKFQLKYIDWPRLVWRNYSSQLVWSSPSHSAWWSLCWSVTVRKNSKIASFRLLA